MADIDDQIQDALRKSIQAGYGMGEALDGIHEGLTSAGAKPEWARSKLAKYGYAPQPEKPGFGSELYNQLIAPAQAGVAAFSDPTGIGLMDLFKGLWQGQAQQGSEAMDALRGRGSYTGFGLPGRISEAAGHGMAALLPGLGPMAARTGENIGDKNLGASLADILSLRAATMGMRETPTGVQAFAGDPVNYHPEIAMSRARIPTEESTIARIKQASGRSFRDVDELMEDSQKAATQARQALEPYFQRAEQSGLVSLRGDQVVQATQKAVDKILTKPSEAELKQAIMDETRTDFGREISLRGWKQELETINKQEYGFYNRAPDAQRASLGKVQEAVRKAQRDSMADMLYKTLSPEDAGAGPKEIQASLGKILETMDTAKKQARSIRKESPVSNAETARRAVNAGLHMAAIPLRAVFSDNAIGDPISAVVGKSNTLLRRAAAAVDAETKPYPRPLNAQHPAAPQPQAPPAAAPQPANVQPPPRLAGPRPLLPTTGGPASVGLTPGQP